MAISASVLVASAGRLPSAAEQQEVSFSLGGVDFLGSGPSVAELSAGVFNVHDRDEGFFGDSSALGGLEWRHGGKLWAVGPMLGILANSDGGVFGYGGIYADIRLGNFVITPKLSAGGYHRGDGVDLGSTFQFRSAITFSYRFEDGTRLGIGGSHISNASIDDRNPGVEEIFVSLAFPLPF